MAEKKNLADVKAALSKIISDDADRVYHNSEVTELLPLLDSEDDARALLLEKVGDLARKEENRGVLGEVGIVDEVVKAIVNQEDLQNPILKQAARALGNLCFDHNDNRQRAFTPALITALVTVIKSPAEQIRRTVCGAVANLASENETWQKTFADNGFIPLLLNILRTDQPEVQYMAARALANICEFEANQDVFLKEGGVKACVGLLFTDDDSLQEECVHLLQSLFSTKHLQVPIVQEGVLKPLLTIAPNLPAAFELLATISDTEECRAQFLSFLPLLVKMTHSPDDSVVKETTKILGNLCLDDSVMEALYPEVNHFRNLLKARSNLDEQLNIMMILANLARKDTYCTEMVDSGFHNDMISVCLPATDARMQHMAIGTLRNLAIPAKNKQKIATPETWKLVRQMLDSKNAHVLFATIGLIKTLISGPEEILDQFAKEEELLQALVTVSLGENMMEGQERIIYEGARTIAMVIHRKEENREGLIKLGCLKPLLSLLKTNFEILKWEATNAFFNLASQASNVQAMVNEGVVKELVELCKALKDLPPPEKPHDPTTGPSPQDTLKLARVTLKLLAPEDPEVVPLL